MNPAKRNIVYQAEKILGRGFTEEEKMKYLAYYFQHGLDKALEMAVAKKEKENEAAGKARVNNDVSHIAFVSEKEDITKLPQIEGLTLIGNVYVRKNNIRDIVPHWQLVQDGLLSQEHENYYLKKTGHDIDDSKIKLDLTKSEREKLIKQIKIQTSESLDRYTNVELLKLLKAQDSYIKLRHNIYNDLYKAGKQIEIE